MKRPEKRDIPKGLEHLWKYECDIDFNQGLELGFKYMNHILTKLANKITIKKIIDDCIRDIPEGFEKNHDLFVEIEHRLSKKIKAEIK